MSAEKQQAGIRQTPALPADRSSYCFRSEAGQRQDCQQLLFRLSVPSAAGSLPMPYPAAGCIRPVLLFLSAGSEDPDRDFSIPVLRCCLKSGSPLKVLHWSSRLSQHFRHPNRIPDSSRSRLRSIPEGIQHRQEVLRWDPPCVPERSGSARKIPAENLLPVLNSFWNGAKTGPTGIRYSIRMTKML